jgi:hypothetical protein
VPVQAYDDDDDGKRSLSRHQTQMGINIKMNLIKIGRESVD